MPLDSKPWTNPEVEALDADGEILERAAQIIEKQGWCQNADDPLGGPRCAVMAIIDASYELNGDCLPALQRLGVGDHAGLVGHWNDMPGRTAAEVIARLRAAARGKL